MRELITICKHDFGGGLILTVNARDLWIFLGSKQKFSTWIKRRIKKYKFVQGKDFILVHRSVAHPSGAKKLIEYHITLAMAKELSMIEATEKGREARVFFIEREEKLQLIESTEEKPPPRVPTALELAEQCVRLIQEKNAFEEKYVEALPDAVYARQIKGTPELMAITIIAKQCGLTAYAMNKWLEKKGVIWFVNGVWVPQAKYQKRDFGRIVTGAQSGTDGIIHMTKHFYWNAKGEQFILHLWAEENNQLPGLEQNKGRK